MHYSTLINQVKSRREALSVSQETLAGLAGVGLRTIKQFESGKGNPTLETLHKITEAVGLEVTLQLKKTNHEV